MPGGRGDGGRGTVRSFPRPGPGGPGHTGARWWSVRRAQNRKPATYRCPLCHGFLPALSEHLLISPEGDTRRRRHAHSDCVMKARRAGMLPTREDWQRSQPRSPALWRRALGRLRAALGGAGQRGEG